MNVKRIVAVVLVALALAGCGESKAEERERRTNEVIDAMRG